jgi:ATP-dependent RNA helicase DDX46/PRP5
VHIVKALRQSGQEVAEDLLKMEADFKQKVKDGKEKWYDGGFGGKGLDRLDEARALEKKREKRAHKGDFGNDSDSEPEELPKLPTAGASTTAAASTTTTAAAEPAYMRLLRGGPIVNKTERPAFDSSKTKMTAVERARAAAMGVDARLSKKGTVHAGQPIDNKGPDAGAFHSTIEINDFPQKARWAVSHPKLKLLAC